MNLFSRKEMGEAVRIRDHILNILGSNPAALTIPLFFFKGPNPGIRKINTHKIYISQLYTM